MKVIFSRVLLFPLLILTLLISACSSSMFYRNLNWITLWYVDDYVSLNADQKKIYTSKFNELQQWHREYELENYQLLLSSIETQINSGNLGNSELEQVVHNHHSTVQTLWKNLASKLGSSLYDLSLQLTTAQRQELLKNLAQKNQDHFEKNHALSSEGWQEKKSKRLTKALSRWTGTLTRDQQKMVQQWAADLHRLDDQHHQFRQHWLAELEMVLQLPDNKSRSGLIRLLSERESYMPEEYLQKLVANRQLTEKLIARIIIHRTGGQHDKIVQELHRWLDMINKEIQS